MLSIRSAALSNNLLSGSINRSSKAVSQRRVSSQVVLFFHNVILTLRLGSLLKTNKTKCNSHRWPTFLENLSPPTMENRGIPSKQIVRNYTTKPTTASTEEVLQVPVLFLNSPEAAIYPGSSTPSSRATLFISEGQFERYKSLDTQQIIGLFMVPEGNEDIAAKEPHATKHVASIGVLAWVENVVKANEGYNVTFGGQQRIKFDERVRANEDESQTPEEPLIRTVVRIKDDTISNKSTDLIMKAYHGAITNFLGTQGTGNASLDYNDAVWSAAALCSSDATTAQKLLDSLQLVERQYLVLCMIRTFEALKVMQLKISQKVDEEVNAGNRLYLLKQQMKHLKKEIGGDDDKKAGAKMYEARLKGLNVPEAVMKVIKEEMGKLSGSEMHSSEQNVVRNYLDWLTSIPWGIYNKENLDIHHAEKVLSEDHYGLKDVKERILEFIAVGKLRAGVQGKILCFVGPPGVGKTSIGKSIAKATNREFYRFSLGGMRDVAEIRGHRRTYIGAMPGKIVQCLKTVKSQNPVIMIDEIDKMGSSYNGDPASALLEVLDREQNSAFMDLYMDVPIDLSKVLWVATANTKDTIPAPLLDRMEVVKLSGYVLEEKVQIANKYLIPKGLTEHGLPANQVKFQKDAISSLITNWCRESGVRNLQNHIEKILRKIAFHVVKEGKVIEVPAETPQAIAEATAAPLETESTETKAAEKGKGRRKKKESKGESDKLKEKIVQKMSQPAQLTETIVVDEASLPNYVGKPNFNSERYYDVTPVGVVMGLAWTSM
ncbi:lon protease like protein, partial [Planoprotostelium fungivorum]